MSGYRECFERELKRRYPAEFAGLWLEIDERYRRIGPDVAFARTSSKVWPEWFWLM